MKRGGWFQESWRHGLAAKGVKTGTGTKYFAYRSFMADKDGSSERRRRESKREKLNRIIMDPTSTESEKQAAREEKVNLEKEAEVKREGIRERSAGGLTPGTLLERLSTQQKLEEAALGRYVDTTPVGKLVRGIQAGAYSVDGLSYKQVLANPKYSAADKLRVKNAINAAAISAASAGLEIPSDAEFQGQLTEQTKAQVRAIQKDKAAQRRGALATAAIGESEEFAIESEKAIVSAPGKLLGGLGDIGKGAIEAGEEGLKSAKAPAVGSLYPDVPGGLIPGDVLNTPAGYGPGSNQFFGGETEQARKDSLFFGGNPLTTAGVQDNEGAGKLSPLSDISVDAFGKKAAGATNESRLLHTEVESLWGARDSMAGVSLNSFKEGNEAFKKGNREKLIKAINDLDAEEQKIRDRWMLVEQTRAFMLSPRTRASALREESGVLGLLGIGGSGGRQLAEDSERINALKRDIKNSHNEVFARKTDLRYKLRRMDATVPSQTEVPRDVKVFEEKGAGMLPDAVKPSVALRTAFGPRGD